MHVLVVDAFATEPMAGRPVAVVPDGGLSDDQYRAIAGELGADAVLAVEDGAPRAVGEGGHVSAAVAAGALVDEAYEPGDVTVTGTTELSATVRADGTVAVDLPPAEHRVVDADDREIADVLGIDSAALADVGADLPAARVDAGRGALAVPVNFLEHLGGADPDGAALAALLDAVDAALLYAFTFDTLAAGTAWHARAFSPDGERVAAARAAAACGAYVRDAGAIDADETEVVAASGQFLDRPSRVTVDLEASRVRGHALTVFDGTVTVPDSSEDDIIEV
jgi:predicted PhzF superfamily epimerase YddE/YHI9